MFNNSIKITARLHSEILPSGVVMKEENTAAQVCIS